LARYSVVAALAVIFGRQILSITRSTAFFWAMIGFIVVSAGGSAYSVFGWIRRSRAAKAARPKHGF
jgi:hypothetical protein